MEYAVNKYRKYIFIIFLFQLFPSFCNTANAETDNETFKRHYPVPEHGELILDVPAEWEVTYFSPSEKKPPIITFYKKDDQKKEVFQLNLSPLWDDGFKRNITEPEQIYKFVEEVGQTILEMSDQTRLELQSFKGEAGEGYFFKLTDSKAGVNEYRYLTQGAISIGEILVVFSLFSHDADSIIHKKAFKMLQTAIHKFQRDV